MYDLRRDMYRAHAVRAITILEVPHAFGDMIEHLAARRNQLPIAAAPMPTH